MEGQTGRWTDLDLLYEEYVTERDSALTLTQSSVTPLHPESVSRGRGLSDLVQSLIRDGSLRNVCALA